MLCENCVRARGALSACGARSFQRDTRRCACSPAARAGWPPVARAQKRCCMLPSPILPKEGSPKIDGGGDRGLVFLLIFFVFDISLSDRGQQLRSSREGGARHWQRRWEAEVVRRGRRIMFVFRFSIDHRHYSAVWCAAYEAPETGAALALASWSPRRAAELSGTRG